MRNEKPKRTRDPSAKRVAILAAARQHFAHNNYDGVGLRQIAADAGVDVALVVKYFISKEKLFIEVLKSELSAEYITQFDKSEVAAKLVDTLLRDYTGSQSDGYLRLLINAAASPNFVQTLKAIMEDQVLGPLTEWLGGDDADLRARLLITIASGAGLCFMATHFENGLQPEQAQALRTKLSAYIQSIIDRD